MALNSFSKTFTDTQVVAGKLSITKPSNAYVCKFAIVSLAGLATVTCGITNTSASDISIDVGEVPKGVSTITIIYS